MSKSEELLKHLYFQFTDTSFAGKNYKEFKSRTLSNEIVEEIENYLNRKDKLVVGSEWVCDVDCYGVLNGMSPLIVDCGMEVVVTSEDKNTFVQIEIDYCGIISSFQIPYNQFLACFSPKEEE